MDTSNKRNTLPPAPPCSHHHHHQCLEISPHCPQHNTYFSHPNTPHNHLQLSPACPLHGHLLPHCPLHSINHHFTTNPPSLHFPPNPNFSSLPLQPVAYSKSELPTMMQDMDEEADDEEFTYVLTDEWKEFFAKSEAKRRLAKKQAKKKGKD